MEYAHDLLQATADYSISLQRYFWSSLGYTPAEATKLAQTQTPSVTILGGQQASMNALIRRVAGVSGAVAVAMSAFSAHRILMDPTIDERRKKAVENANKHHFIHTFGIFFASKSRYPALTVALFSSGIIMFCGSCYMYGIWNNDKIRAISPLGGLMFILGWLSFVL